MTISELRQWVADRDVGGTFIDTWVNSPDGNAHWPR